MTNDTESVDTIAQQQKAATHMEERTSTDLNWVFFADAKVDVNFAISKQNFKLLAYTNRTISLPGIDLKKHDLPQLKQLCGYRFLPGSGDVIVGKQDLKRRKVLRLYTTEYNQLMLDACQAHTNPK